jgi:hypothetical protein
MIGAKDSADAMREAARSTDKPHGLEVWDGTRYVAAPADPLPSESEPLPGQSELTPREIEVMRAIGEREPGAIRRG